MAGILIWRETRQQDIRAPLTKTTSTLVHKYISEYATMWCTVGIGAETVCVCVCLRWSSLWFQQTLSSSKRSVKWSISANCLASACSLSRCWVGVKGGHVRDSSKLCRASSADKHTHTHLGGQLLFRCQMPQELFQLRIYVQSHLTKKRSRELVNLFWHRHECSFCPIMDFYFLSKITSIGGISEWKICLY